MNRVQLTIYTDGGARGNPGPAAIGFIVIDHQDRVLKRYGEPIGRTTNNVAEYQALIKAFNWVDQQSPMVPETIKVFMDSQLIINQLNGVFKVKDHKLKALIMQLRALEQTFHQKGSKIFYQYIPRLQNQLADALVNQALDTNSIVDHTSIN